MAGTNFDGSGQFKFALVNGATGATDVWWTSSPDISPQDGTPDAAVTLPVAKGLYSVSLGDSSVTNMAAIPAGAFAHDDVRLRVWFSDGVRGFQKLTPDQRITSVGYALVAENVPDGAITAAKLAPGAVTSASIADGSIKLSQLDASSINPASLGAETPAGAQAKIDAEITATLGNSGGMAALKTILAEGHVSTGIAIVSDSTNAGGAWSTGLIDKIGALYPAYTIRRTDWTPSDTAWSPPVTDQQGAAGGERRWEFPPGAVYCPSGPPADFPMPTGDLDIRVKARIDNNSSSANMLFSKADNGGRFGFRLWQGAASQSRALILDYSVDGSTTFSAFSSAGVAANGIADGTPYWSRVTVDINNGSGGKTFTFYTSTDGATWTPLGTPVVSASGGTAPLAGAGAYCYLGGYGSIVYFSGAIYAAEIHSGINGPTVHPLSMDAWSFDEGSAYLTGAPELWVSNAAWPGASVDSFLGTPTLNYCRNYLPEIIFVSLSHNSPREAGNAFINKMKYLTANVRSVYGDIPKIILLTQNPQLDVPQSNNPNELYQSALATHRAQFMSWASNAGYGVIDTWAAFTSDPRPREILVGTNVWSYKPITSISGNGTTVTVNVADMSYLSPAGIVQFAVIGLTLPGGAPSHFNGAYSILAKSGNATGPGWITYASPVVESPVVLTGASAASSDGIHPSVAGYQLWTDTIFAAFKRGTP